MRFIAWFQTISLSITNGSIPRGDNVRCACSTTRYFRKHKYSLYWACFSQIARKKLCRLFPDQDLKCILGLQRYFWPAPPTLWQLSTKKWWVCFWVTSRYFLRLFVVTQMKPWNLKECLNRFCYLIKGSDWSWNSYFICSMQLMAVLLLESGLRCRKSGLTAER